MTVAHTCCPALQNRIWNIPSHAPILPRRIGELCSEENKTETEMKVGITL